MQRRLKQRRAARPRAGLSKLALTPAARRAALRMLMERFVLRHDQLEFQDRMGANDVRRYETYSYMMHILSEVWTACHRERRSPKVKCYCVQDIPFAAINIIFLTRIVAARACGNDAARAGGNDGQQGSFTIQLLILLTSVIAVVYKAMHLKDLPVVWRERAQLLVEKHELAQRQRALNASAHQGIADDTEHTVLHTCSAFKRFAVGSVLTDLAVAKGSEIAEDTESKSAAGETRIPLITLAAAADCPSADTAETGDRYLCASRSAVFGRSIASVQGGFGDGTPALLASTTRSEGLFLQYDASSERVCVRLPILEVARSDDSYEACYDDPEQPRE